MARQFRIASLIQTPDPITEPRRHWLNRDLRLHLPLPHSSPTSNHPTPNTSSAHSKTERQKRIPYRHASPSSPSPAPVHGRRATPAVSSGLPAGQPSPAPPPSSSHPNRACPLVPRPRDDAACCHGSRPLLPEPGRCPVAARDWMRGAVPRYLGEPHYYHGSQS